MYNNYIYGFSLETVIFISELFKVSPMFNNYTPPFMIYIFAMVVIIDLIKIILIYLQEAEKFLFILSPLQERRDNNKFSRTRRVNNILQFSWVVNKKDKQR